KFTVSIADLGIDPGVAVAHAHARLRGAVADDVTDHDHLLLRLRLFAHHGRVGRGRTLGRTTAEQRGEQGDDKPGPRWHRRPPTYTPAHRSVEPARRLLPRRSCPRPHERSSACCCATTAAPTPTKPAFGSSATLLRRCFSCSTSRCCSARRSTPPTRRGLPRR